MNCAKDFGQFIQKKRHQKSLSLKYFAFNIGLLKKIGIFCTIKF